MKKAIVLIAAIMLLAGCGKNPSGPETSSPKGHSVTFVITTLGQISKTVKFQYSIGVIPANASGNFSGYSGGGKQIFDVRDSSWTQTFYVASGDTYSFSASNVDDAGVISISIYEGDAVVASVSGAGIGKEISLSGKFK